MPWKMSTNYERLGTKVLNIKHSLELMLVLGIRHFDEVPTKMKCFAWNSIFILLLVYKSDEKANPPHSSVTIFDFVFENMPFLLPWQPNKVSNLDKSLINQIEPLIRNILKTAVRQQNCPFPLFLIKNPRKQLVVSATKIW